MYKRVKDIEGFPSTMKKLLKELKFNGVDLIKKLRLIFSKINDQLEEVRKDAEELNILRLNKDRNLTRGEFYETDPDTLRGITQTISLDFDPEEDKKVNQYKDKLTLGNVSKTKNIGGDVYEEMVESAGDILYTEIFEGQYKKFIEGPSGSDVLTINKDSLEHEKEHKMEISDFFKKTSYKDNVALKEEVLTTGKDSVKTSTKFLGRSLINSVNVSNSDDKETLGKEELIHSNYYELSFGGVFRFQFIIDKDKAVVKHNNATLLEGGTVVKSFEHDRGILTRKITLDYIEANYVKLSVYNKYVKDASDRMADIEAVNKAQDTKIKNLEDALNSLTVRVNALEDK